MSDLNTNRPFSTVYGHPIARFEQDGLSYDAAGKLIGTARTVAADPRVVTSERIHTDALDSAMRFLRNILAAGPLSKSVVYKESEASVQDWNSVRDAAIELKIHKFQYRGSEMWKLPEEEEVA
jgi:hypothetical protein